MLSKFSLILPDGIMALFFKIFTCHSKSDLDSKFIITNSVKGMLPHNRLGRKLINHLKVYNGNSHPHESQNPKLMEI